MRRGSGRLFRSIDRVSDHRDSPEPQAAGNLALSLFASALVGKPVPLEVTQSPVGSSDGSVIYVPAGLDQGSIEARYLVICQASLQQSGSYRKDVLRKLNRGGSDIARRYLTLEVLRSCRAREGMLPRSFNAALDDVGAGIRPSATPAESLSRARSIERLPAPPPWFGELTPSRILSAGNCTAPGDSAGNELAASDLLPEVDDEDDDTASGERSRIMELFSAPMRNPFGEALQKLLGMGRSPGDGTAGDEVPIVGARTGHGNSAKGRLVPGGGQPRIEMAGELVVGAAYPEWDTHRRTYHEAWTLVGEFDPAPADDVEPTGAGPNRSLMRALAQLGLAWETHRAEPMGDNLDISALVDLHTNIAAGHGGEALVYTAARRTSQRLGVLVLLDATGSTAETADGETVFAAQRNLAFEVTSALDRLGVRTATYGFYSQGRRNVRFLHAKSFNEPWSAAAQRRLLSIGPSGFTRLGAAIRHATNLVATRAGTDHQLVVVIGDGVVFDHGYEGRYATEDSRFAIEEAALRGVAIAGLSVCPTPDESIWPLAQHRVVHDADELAPQVRDLFGGALGRARSAQRPRHPQRSVYVSAGI
jgi:hypothetical protein